MWEDPIVTEVRKIREEYAAQFNFDLHQLCHALKEQEQRDPRPKVSLPARSAKTVQEKKAMELLLRETAAWDAASDEDALEIAKRLAEMK
jgi:hypothetical protein